MMIDEKALQSEAGDSDKVLTFPLGIPGFEKYTTYVVYHKEENDINAYWLESCEEPRVTFTLVEPGQYGLNYELELDDRERNILQAENADDLAVFLVLSKKASASGEGKTPGLNANITGPIIINTRTKRGLQKVLVRARSRLDTTIIQL